jgi:hypothetical protein
MVLSKVLLFLNMTIDSFNIDSRSEHPTLLSFDRLLTLRFLIRTIRTFPFDMLHIVWYGVVWCTPVHAHSVQQDQCLPKLGELHSWLCGRRRI